MHNTDEVFTNPATIPTPEQEDMPTRLIDIHIYDLHPDVPEEETQSIESTLEAQEEPPQTTEWQEQTEALEKKSKQRVSPLLLVLIGLFLFILVGGSLSYFLLFTPTVTVTIIPKSQQLETTGSVTLVTANAGTSDQVKGRILPSITMSQTQTEATTGTTSQEARPGRGTITFYNAALYSQTVAANTLITGQDDKQVVTDYAVTVPPGTLATNGQATVTAHSVITGSAGNMKAQDIYGDCCLLKISAVNSAFTGGQEAESYQSVAQRDIDAAEAHLKTSLTQAVTAALDTQVQNSETLVTPLSCQPTVTTDHSLGEKASLVQVTLTEACMGLTYDTASFQHVMGKMQTNAAGSDLLEHYHLAGEVHATIQTITEDSTTGTYQLAVQGSGTWVYQFSQEQLSHLAATIAGKTSKEATQALLHTPGIQQVSFTAGMLPSDPQKIHVLLLLQQ